MASTPASPDQAAGFPEPPLFRFGLRQLFFFVALVSGVLAAAVLSRGIAALAMILAVLVVAAHLFSTALASRLRSRADAVRERAGAWDAARQPRELTEHSRMAKIPACARSPWHARGSTSLPWLPWAIVAGILIGGLVGAIVLGFSIGHRSTVAGIAVGGISSAILGGWFAFLMGSFYGIFRHGLRDAIANQQADEQRGRRGL